MEYFSNLIANDPNPIENAPELILLDINMPIMNGWEFLQEFVPLYGEKLADTRIVILSSTIDPEDFANAKKYPIVSQFISKPLSVENLEDLKENVYIKSYFS